MNFCYFTHRMSTPVRSGAGPPGQLEVALLVTRLRPRNANFKVTEVIRLKYSIKLSWQEINFLNELNCPPYV
jgi:hypothetical protein